MVASFSCLVRFKDSNGKIRYGDVPSGPDDLVGKTANVLSGEEPWDLKPTQETAQIGEVLSPLESIPLVYGIGLNYKKHIEESGFPTPEFPVVFTKPGDSLAGPYEDIPVDERCELLDYEGELLVVIGKDVRNFRKGEDPLPYILGYSVSNDVSSRFWQTPERCGNQHGMAKSFDKFAPIGPAIVSPESPLIKDKIQDGAPNLLLQTFVNGELRQETNTDDLLFRVSALLEYISMGRTVRRGTIIMTGTPSGVAAFMKPPGWLKNGDIVEIKIEGLGSIKNKMVIGSK
jgi:2-keto-4-pentenoate hydratase/2-oxohepta-3-ene-1,7-dioic acid hydratase in catechol pathway